MTYTYLYFLFAFLPIGLLVYYIVPFRFRKYVMILLSMMFYISGEVTYFYLLIIALAVNLILGCVIIRLREVKTAGKLLLLAGVVFNVGLLGYFKFAAFAAVNLNRFLPISLPVRSGGIPLGLSYFTFKAISYLVDGYNGNIAVFEPVNALLYLSFFPQIQSGPIARYDTVLTPQKKPIMSGAVRFILGAGKKVLLANTLNLVVIEIFDRTSNLSTSLAWLGSFTYALMLYYDFSGYSDMALGITNMFGYPCPENFNYPYCSASISEFWRRWHITLGSWFRDYIYIPMGGSRTGKVRVMLNLLVVWLCTGMWHGASGSFIAWGLGYFVLIALEKTLHMPHRLKGRAGRIIYRIFTLICVIILWVPFRSSGMGQTMLFLSKMFVPRAQQIADMRAVFLLQDYRVPYIAALIFAVPVLPALKRYCERRRSTRMIFYILSVPALAAVLAAVLALTVGGQNNPFLYLNF